MPPWAVEWKAGDEPRVRPPRARKNGFAAYPGVFNGNWVVFGEAPQIPAVGNLAWNAAGEPAPLPGVRIHQWVAAPPQPFVVQNPPPPPPLANATRDERKLAQDRALRDAYKSAPAEVQARRREQMRRMMKDPTLDDAAVERAILRVGEFADAAPGSFAALGRPEMERARGILDRLQGRGEQHGARPARRPTPSPPRPVNPHPQEPFPALDALLLAEDFRHNVQDPNFLGIDSDSDDDDDVNLYQQLGQARLDVEVEMRRLEEEERRLAQPPPAPRLQPVRGPFDAPPDGRENVELSNQRREGLRARYIRPAQEAYVGMVAPGAREPAAPAARPREDAMAYGPALKIRLNPYGGFPLYAPPQLGNHAPDQQPRDEVAASVEMDGAELGDRGRSARLRERVRMRSVMLLNERAEANNNPIPARLREEHVGYQQRQEDALREDFTRHTRIQRDALDIEARRLRENMRRVVGMPPMAENEDAPVNPDHGQPVMGGEAARLNNMIAEGEARMLQGGAGRVRNPWPLMPPMPAMAPIPIRVVAQHGREVIWNARPAPGAQRPIVVQPRIRDEGVNDDDLFMMNALVPVLSPARRPLPPGHGHARSTGAIPSTPPRKTADPTQRQSPLNPRARPFQPGGVSAVFQGVIQQLDGREAGNLASSSPIVRPGVEMQMPVKRRVGSGSEVEDGNLIDLGFSTPVRGRESSGTKDGEEKLIELGSSPPCRWQQRFRRPSMDDGAAQASSPPPRPQPESESENEEQGQEELGVSRNEGRHMISDEGEGEEL